MNDYDLDKVFIEGACFILHKNNWTGKTYREEFKNPTLWDIVQFANQSVLVVDDLHHIYLEAICLKGHVDGISNWELSFGS